MPAKNRRPELEEVQGKFKFPIRLPSGNTEAEIGLGEGGRNGRDRPGARGIFLP